MANCRNESVTLNLIRTLGNGKVLPLFPDQDCLMPYNMKEAYSISYNVGVRRNVLTVHPHDVVIIICALLSY